MQFFLLELLFLRNCRKLSANCLTNLADCFNVLADSPHCCVAARSSVLTYSGTLRSSALARLALRIIRFARIYLTKFLYYEVFKVHAALSATAYLYYHNQVILSSTFSNFFYDFLFLLRRCRNVENRTRDKPLWKSFSRSFAAALSATAYLYYHHLRVMSISFF